MRGWKGMEGRSDGSSWNRGGVLLGEEKGSGWTRGVAEEQGGEGQVRRK